MSARMKRVCARGTWLGVLAAMSSLASGANAQQAKPDEVDGSVGGMLFLGGNLFTTPDNRPVERSGKESDGLGFAGDAGGFGWGIGAYAEARIVEHLGLNLGFLFDRSILKRDVDFVRTNGTASSTVVYEERVTMLSLRFPLLIKGILPVTFGRAWAGLGPEIVVTRWVDAELDPT